VNWQFMEQAELGVGHSRRTKMDGEALVLGDSQVTERGEHVGLRKKTDGKKRLGGELTIDGAS